MTNVFVVSEQECDYDECEYILGVFSEHEKATEYIVSLGGKYKDKGDVFIANRVGMENMMYSICEFELNKIKEIEKED